MSCIKFVSAALVVPALLIPISSSAAESVGKVEVCRHKQIVGAADKSPATLQAPIKLRHYDRLRNIDSDSVIVIDHELRIGARPSCVRAEARLMNATGDRVPRVGWMADAQAAPGQWWGVRPADPDAPRNPAAGGEIQQVMVQARIVEPFH